MHWVSEFTSQVDTVAAARELCDSLERSWGSRAIDLLLVFFSGAHVAGAEELATEIRERLRPGCLIGASAHGVISSRHEVETGPAISVLAGSLPGVEVRPFLMVSSAWSAAIEDPLEFRRCTPGVEDAEVVVALADGFSFDIGSCLSAFNRHAPSIRVVGGIASAGMQPGTNVLLLNDWVSREGGVAVALKGALRVDVVVSQGCRPVGPTLEVTRCQGNLLVELDGQPALERAEQVLRALPEKERVFLKHGLYVGRPARAGARGQGDYLIRNLLGADRERGVMAIADVIAERERIRLHVRDAETAVEDLEMLLSPQTVDGPASAALLFACNSRGRSLFGEPDRDITTLQSALGGAAPIAGMFCAGEIGPVGDHNLLHGHTASIAIVRP
jgi:small ligand-binding sensory domain FIST